MIIVSPRELQACEGRVIPIVAEGEWSGLIWCRLLSQAVWEGVVLRGDQPPGGPRTPLARRAEKVWCGALEVNEGIFGKSIITIVDDSNAVIAAGAILLGRSLTAPIRRRSPDGNSLHWPLSYFTSEIATFGGLPGPTVPIQISNLSRPQLFSESLKTARVSTIFEDRNIQNADLAFRKDLSAGLELESFTRLESQMTWSSPHLYYLRCRDALIDLHNGILCDEDGHIWIDSAVATLSSVSSTERTDAWFWADGSLGLALGIDPPKLKNSRPLMMFCHWASLVNHAHWIMNSLVSVYHVLPELKRREIDLLCPPLRSSSRSELVAIGVPREAIIEIVDRFIRVEDVIFPSPLSTLANMHPPPSSTQYYSHIRESYTSDLVEYPKRIFFTRRGFPTGRKLKNEQEIELLLTGLGFLVIAPHELSLSEEVAIVSRSEIIVSQLGSALTNIAFAPKGTRVIEITSSNYTSNEYCLTASLCGHEYIRLMTEPLKENYVNEGSFEFCADLEALRNAILSP